VESGTLWTWALIAALAVLALAPLLIAALRAAPHGTRLRREADIALYRAQLAELDREREAGRLDEAAHRAATLEVQRRLLAAPADEAEPPRTATMGGREARIALLVALGLVPALAVLLYRWQGVPGMPSASFAERRAVMDRDEALLATLRARLAQLDPRSEQARAGYALLGNAERGRGRLEAAEAAYRASLAAGFDAAVAGQLAQVLLERERLEEARALLAASLPRAPQDVGLRFLSGLVEAQAGRPEQAKATWQALIDDAPPDAPWRAMVQRRMADLP
jgi:cytochrome c-type biogenesis protein CcmH